jgi:phosphomannomutase
MEDVERDLRARAERWANEDPDPETKSELLTLLSTPDLAKTDLAERFAGALEFGTAGLRGILGAGPNRMNRAVVLRTTWGLLHELQASGVATSERSVVVGYDGRRYSREFALDTVLVLAAGGIRAHLFVHPVPTPLVAFAVTHLGALAGVMVTASHNPAEYNGYKLYWANGAQIVPPLDEHIAARTASAPAAVNVPRLSRADAERSGLLTPVSERVEASYLEAIRSVSVHGNGDRSIPIVYTALHGVGDALARRALEDAGFSSVASVPEQQEPDGTFPTVPFPNPEEKGAMTLALALAEKRGAKLVLANDPDADRLAVALPCAGSPGYTQLTGNQVGVLLGHYLLTERPAKEGEHRVVMATIVSSPMLGVIARALGARYEETLTGFKWIANLAIELEREGHTFVFGYEEALGYTVGDVVRDKDGIGAAAMVAEMAAVLAARGHTLLSELESICRSYGAFVSSQVSVTRKGAAGAAEIRGMMDRLRSDPPRRIGNSDVHARRDYLAQARVDRDGKRTPLSLPKSNVLAFELGEQGDRIVARPSGTEPKVKFYFDVREAVRSEENVAEADARAQTRMKTMVDAFVALIQT